MTDRPRKLTRLDPLLLLLLWIYFVTAGCKEELGPERMPVARITGVVREGTKPVAGGWIEFIPVDGTVGNLCSAKLNAHGAFDAHRVAIGVNLIRLVNAPLTTPGAAKIFGAFQSPIRREIVAQPSEPLSIDVVEELIRYRSSRGSPAVSESGKTGGGR
jgi:hypothetical protein